MKLFLTPEVAAQIRGAATLINDATGSIKENKIVRVNLSTLSNMLSIDRNQIYKHIGDHAIYEVLLTGRDIAEGTVLTENIRKYVPEY